MYKYVEVNSCIYPEPRKLKTPHTFFKIPDQSIENNKGRLTWCSLTQNPRHCVCGIESDYFLNIISFEQTFHSIIQGQSKQHDAKKKTENKTVEIKMDTLDIQTNNIIPGIT